MPACFQLRFEIRRAVCGGLGGEVGVRGVGGGPAGDVDGVWAMEVGGAERDGGGVLDLNVELGRGWEDAVVGWCIG